MSASFPRRFAGGRTLSVAEWEALPEDEPGELVDGRLVGEEMPDLVHEVVVVWLVEALRRWLRPLGGVVVGSELKLVVASGRGRKADVVAYFPAHPPLPERGVVRVPPDLLVEVISPTSSDRRRDRVDKASDYAAFGVRRYWLLDPEERTLEFLELDSDGRFAKVLDARAGTVDRVPGCKGLVLDLDALWAEIDELVDDVAGEVDLES
jgi:Uma2 family endonuclease